MDAGGLLQGGLDRRLDDVLDRVERGLVDRAALAPRGPEPAAGHALGARRLGSLGPAAGLEPALDESGEHVLEALGRAPVGRRLGAEALEQRLLLCFEVLV